MQERSVESMTAKHLAGQGQKAKRRELDSGWVVLIRALSVR